MINIPIPSTSTKRYFLGCDLAKSLDYTSFSVIEMEIPEAGDSDSIYHLTGLDRIRGVDYPQITALILSTIKRLEEEGGSIDGPHLCMDASGLGAPIRDYLKAANIFGVNTVGWGTSRLTKTKNHIELEPGEATPETRKVIPKELYPVVFTGGEAARHDPTTGNYNISKTLIMSNFLSLMQHRRFDYAADLQALLLLEEEISNFKYHLTPSGHTTMDAVSGKHDDLICAVCIPLIIAEWKYNRAPKPMEFIIPKHAIVGRGYNPLWRY